MTQSQETRAGRLAAALDEFIRSAPDVEAAAVVSFDGLCMASALPPDLEEDRVGAMSAALLSLGEQAAIGLGRGPLNQVFVEGQDGFVFLMSARDQAVLAAIAGRTAKIGFMLFEMRRAAERIGIALETPVGPAAGFVPDEPAAAESRADEPAAAESPADEGASKSWVESTPWVAPAVGSGLAGPDPSGSADQSADPDENDITMFDDPPPSPPINLVRHPDDAAAWQQ